MQKNKKLLTEAAQQPRRGLKINDSPKKVGKLKLGLLLDEQKEKQFHQINESVRQKLEQPPSTSKQHSHNPYQSGYLNDLALWKEYCQSTQKYERSGISLKWPYYFSVSPNKPKE